MAFISTTDDPEVKVAPAQSIVLDTTARLPAMITLLQVEVDPATSRPAASTSEAVATFPESSMRVHVELASDS